MGRVPVRRLQRLVEFDAEKLLGREFEARPALAGQKTAGLQGAVGFERRDAGLFEERQFERRVVGDDAHVFEAPKDAGAGAIEIDHRDVRSAAVELEKSDAGAVRVETGARGVVDRRIQALDLRPSARRRAA